MDLSSIKLFSMMKHRMAYIGERQTVLARNVANANTPGYIPNDLEKVDFSKMASRSVSQIKMRTTSASHIALTSGMQSKFKVVQQKNLTEMTPTGNAVVLEEQMLKMSENSMDYATTTSLYKKMNNLMNIAIEGNR